MGNYPEVSIGMVRNLFTRQMHFLKKGDHEIQHEHQFDHTTLLAKGSIELTVDGVKTTFVAPQMIFISKNKEHSMVALEDDTLCYCIHPLEIQINDNTKIMDDIVYPEMIPNGIDKIG